MAEIRVDRVSKWFGGIKALDNVSLEVSRGEVIGLIGPNGSGKTTLLNILRCLLKPDRGLIEISGVMLNGMDPERLADLGVASIYQFPRVIRDLTVVENVALAVLKRQKSLWRAELLAIEYLKDVGLGGKAYTMAARLNRYEVRLMELARAMAMRPRVLLIDELLSGLSEEEQRDIRELVRSYLDSSGATAIWVEHAIGSLVREVDRLVVLNHGSIIADGEPERVIRDQRVIEAYLGSYTIA
ncbi:MAG TPA: ATP-binding cassette domain-containing protein [Sulfolobales archaeon]|nr:ATP-binding cassette domain-containing protein [Sulfolobales archaeon]